MTNPECNPNPTTSRPAGATTPDPGTLAPALTMLTVPQAARVLGIGRTLAYELIRTDAWPTPIIRAGRLIRIPVDVQVIPWSGVHVIPWSAVDVLPGFLCCCQLWWVEHVADLGGQELGGGPAEAGGEDCVLVAAA
jgi:predicted DNA-binding transcriptional regulator AlpA